MLNYLGIIAAVTGLVSTDIDMNNVPIEYGTVASAQMRVAISASVRAATWDDLPFKPSNPVNVRLACIVLAKYGIPGGCVPASRITSGLNAIGWAVIRDNYEHVGRYQNLTDFALLQTANQRIATARLPPQPDSKNMFVIKFFEEVISPSDSRPIFFEGKRIDMKDVNLAKPLDDSLFQVLYPPLALRYSATARVTMSCQVEDNLRLLCRDPGMIDIDTNIPAESRRDLITSMRYATYQLASMMEIEPKSKDGQEVVGKQLRIRVTWKLP